MDVGLAALWDALGATGRVLKGTIGYARTRVQFGTSIGRAKALQHRMADMQMHLEQACSMSYMATSSYPDPTARRGTLSATKMLMGQAARYIGQQAVQLRGGISVTDELDVSYDCKRLLTFELRRGRTDQHLRAYRIQPREA